jgi:hypothetical protein
VAVDVAQRDSYHHGDLYNALVEAAVDLARSGGPEAVVLRKVARRVSVSVTSAYRHFASQAAGRMPSPPLGLRRLTSYACGSGSRTGRAAAACCSASCAACARS